MTIKTDAETDLWNLCLTFLPKGILWMLISAVHKTKRMKNKSTTESPATFLTAAELRQRWKVSGMFLHRIRRDGRLSVTRIGKRGVRYAMADVLKIEAESAA